MEPKAKSCETKKFKGSYSNLGFRLRRAGLGFGVQGVVASESSSHCMVHKGPKDSKLLTKVGHAELNTRTRDPGIWEALDKNWSLFPCATLEISEFPTLVQQQKR